MKKLLITLMCFLTSMSLWSMAEYDLFDAEQSAQEERLEVTEMMFALEQDLIGVQSYLMQTLLHLAHSRDQKTIETMFANMNVAMGEISENFKDLRRYEWMLGSRLDRFGGWFAEIQSTIAQTRRLSRR